MKFVHRLAYYMLGVLIGGMFLFFIFQNKRTEFCYMPNCRVLKTIRAKGFVVSNEAQKAIDNNIASMDDLKNTLKDGDVDFDKSNKPNPGGGRLYVIEGVNSKNETIILEIINHENRALLKSIKKQ